LGPCYGKKSEFKNLKLSDIRPLFPNLTTWKSTTPPFHLNTYNTVSIHGYFGNVKLHFFIIKPFSHSVACYLWPNNYYLFISDKSIFSYWQYITNQYVFTYRHKFNTSVTLHMYSSPGDSQNSFTLTAYRLSHPTIFSHSSPVNVRFSNTPPPRILQCKLVGEKRDVLLINN
jgi:hypothetical protein